jgi:ferrochelatase
MGGGPGSIAVLLMAMGGPDKLEHVEAYLREVRGGRPTPPELVEAITERYRLTGGKSPVLDIMREVASKLEERLNSKGHKRYRVHVGFRHWHPFIKDTYANLLREHPALLIGVCMAPQYSAMSVGAYLYQVEVARATLGGTFPVVYVTSWQEHPLFIAAIVDSIRAALTRFPEEERAHVPLLFTAHSLPARILKMKDPYPDHVKATMSAVCRALGPVTAHLAYQSQGASSEPWLGPTVEDMLDELAARGHRHVLVVPIGFVSDHLEVLYDIDIALKQHAAERGMRLERIAMLNSSPLLIEILASIVQQHEPAMTH